MKNLLLYFFVLLFYTDVKVNAQTSPQSDDNIHFHQQIKKAQRNTPYSAAGANSLIYQPTGVRGEEWGLGQWHLVDSTMFVNNTNGQQTSWEYYQYSTGVFRNVEKHIYTYDANGNQNSDIKQEWANNLSAWRNSTKWIKTFDANNNEILYIEQNWDTLSGNWINYRQIMRSFNAANKGKSYINEYWNAGSWHNSSNDIFTYTAHGDLETHLSQDWTGNSWVNSILWSTFFDANNYSTSFLLQNWDDTHSAWKNSGKDSYINDAKGNRILDIQTYWDSAKSQYENYVLDSSAYNAGGFVTLHMNTKWNKNTSIWDKTGLTLYTYDANNGLSSYEIQNWGGNVWVPSLLITYTYDADRNLTHILEQNYSSNTKKYENYSQSFYYYQSFNAKVDENRNDLNAVIFPNPVSAMEVNVKLELAKNSTVVITIYDPLGNIRIAAIQPVNAGINNIEIPLGSISTGNYFIQIIDRHTGKASMLKMTKE